MTQIARHPYRLSIRTKFHFLICFVIFTLAISAGAFFSARQLSHFTRQVAHFTRSWSSGKMLAFQPRGFVFEPVGMRFFFCKYSEAEGSHFFRHYETFRLCETFFRNFLIVPKESSFQFFLIFCNRTNVKNPKGSLFSEFSALSVCSKFSFFVSRKYFKDSLLIFFSNIFNVYKGSALLFV